MAVESSYPIKQIVFAKERGKFTDGYVKLGVAAGDHAAIIWRYSVVWLKLNIT